MTGNVLAIDQGTSGTKALVVSPDGTVIGTGEATVRPRYGDGGLVEVSPGSLLDSVLDAGKQALAAAGEPVTAVGLANQGETTLAWDPRTGEPLTDAIVWQDRRAEALCAELADRADLLREITGLPLDPYFAAPKMAWIRRNLTRDGVVTTSDSWLVHRLTGAFVTDASTASRTLLLDLDSARWSRTAAQVFGLQDERMPRVVDAAGDFGVTTAFGAPVSLTGLLVDQQAALLAESCWEPGEAKCTYGTGAFLLANTGTRAQRSAAGLAGCIAWRFAGETTYCLDGQVYTVASAVRWLTDLGVIGGPEDLDRVGGAVPDTGGVSFVPAFSGLAAPWWRGDVRAAVTGIGLDTGSGHLVRALCEGIAAQVVHLADAVAVDRGAPLTALRVDGGLSRSALLMQTQADLLQMPVEVYASPDATALGAAMAARVGSQPDLPFREALAPWTPAAVYEPRVSADHAAERLDAFRASVTALLEKRA